MSNEFLNHISVTIITKNEENNIGRCLHSVENIADEIIVVDSGSTDGTEEICKSFSKVKFIHKDWLGYAEQKQYAVHCASNEIILSLDADECLSQDLQNDILKKKQSGFSHLEAFELKRKTNYCGKWIHYCGWYPDAQLRLFDRSQCHWLKVPVHEHVVCNSHTKISRLEGDLLHYSYTSLKDHWDRIDKYASLGAEGLIKKKKRFFFIKRYTNAFSRFLKIYVFKFGILDGYYGFCIAVMSAYAVYLKYDKARALSQS